MDRADVTIDEVELERHRQALTSHCQRVLGSPSEAEDAVQETMLRAWRAADRFEGRSTVRTWLYRIATNVCLDMVRCPQRRAKPFDFGEEPPPSLTERCVEVVNDPAELLVTQESVCHAVVALLEHVAPGQRAVLILRDVLRWSAADVAELLDTTVVSVNSALQRARATLAAADLGAKAGDAGAIHPDHRALVARYVDAIERSDLAALLPLLRAGGRTRRPAA